MGETFDNLQLQLNFRLGNRTDPAVSGALRIPDLLPIWVNAAYIDLATRIRLPELEETATLVVDASDLDHPRYLLPTDYFSIAGVRDTSNNNPLTKIPLRRLRERTSTAAAQPSDYVLWRLEIIFDPPLSTGNNFTAQLDYRKRLTKLTGIDPSVLPDEWDEVIVQGSEWRALNDMGGPLKEEAAAAKALYNLMIGERMDRRKEERLIEEETAIPDKVSRPEGSSIG
jgi:hypothetical protein